MLLARRAARRLARDVARVVPPLASDRLRVAQAALEGAVSADAEWTTISDEPRLPFVAAVVPPGRVGPHKPIAGSPVSWIVKVATDPVAIEGLVDEPSGLEALPADDRLGDWRLIAP